MPSTASALDLPFDEAIAFFRQKASVTSERWTDVYAAAHTRSFTVAGATTDALVADFRAEIDKALAEGTTLAEFRKGFDAIVEKHGWEYNGKRGWRTRVIFDTNLRTAYAAGRHAQQTLPETLQAFPYWQYQHSGSLHPRKEHLAWDGLVLAANDPFWTTNYPPNGWNCGCFTTPVSEGGLRRQGKSGPDETPDLLFRAEEVGGVRREIPLGVDPGFEYNPGAEWLTGTVRGLAQRARPTPPPAPPPATLESLPSERPIDEVVDLVRDNELPDRTADAGPLTVAPAEDLAPGERIPSRPRRR